LFYDSEQGIWDRARVRADNAFAAESVAAQRLIASRGMPTMPYGMLTTVLQAAKQKHLDTKAELNLDIATKQADLEQTNRRFAIEAAWKVEEALMRFMGEQQARAVEYLKAANSYLAEMYRSNVTMYGADVQLATANLGAQVDAAKISASIYGSNVQLTAAQMSAQVDHEKVVASVYGTDTSFAAAKVSAQSDDYRTLAQMYGSDISLLAAEVGAQAELIKAQGSLALAGGNLQMEVSRANAQLVLQRATVMVEALKGSASAASQLASSALSAIHVSSSIGASDSVSTSLGASVQYSVSENANHTATSNVAVSAGQTLSENASWNLSAGDSAPITVTIP